MLGLKMMDRKLDRDQNWASPPPSPHIPLSPFSPKKESQDQDCPSCVLEVSELLTEQAWQDPSVFKESEYLPPMPPFPTPEKAAVGTAAGRTFLAFLAGKI